MIGAEESFAYEVDFSAGFSWPQEQGFGRAGFGLQLAVDPLLEGVGQGYDLAQDLHEVGCLVDVFHLVLAFWSFRLSQWS